MHVTPLSDNGQKKGKYAGSQYQQWSRSNRRYSGDSVGDVTSHQGRWAGNDDPGGEYGESMPPIRDMDMPGMQSDVPKYEGNQDGLFRSVNRSFQALEGFRDITEKLVSDYAGSHYGDKAHSDSTPNRYVNMMNQAVEAYQMLLVANRPRVLLTTQLPMYRAFAKHFQHAINALMKEIHLEETLAQWVMDAFFCVGIVKTHMADAGIVELEPDLWMDPGKPFASNISLDDFVFDMKARKWSEVRYAGDMYEMAYADAVELFGEEVMKDHAPRGSMGVDQDRVDGISTSTEVANDDFEPMVDLADIWIPREGKIYTYVVSSRSNFTLAGPNPVAVELWDGDEMGPYHLLGFGDVPENIMPSSPASHLESLDALINDLFRKSSRQARRQKDLHLYTAAGAASAQQIQMADDGDWINVNDTSDVAAMKQGGVDQGNHAFMVGSIDVFDRMAGNLKAQMGLGTQASTVGQEKLVHGAAGQKVDKMSKVVVSAVTRLVRSLGQMLWIDEFKQIASEISIDGAPGISVTSVWKPGDREGNFIDYNFDVDIYSMQYQSPQEKLAKLNETVQAIFVPLAPMLQAQGGMIDMFELARQYADLGNLPELSSIIRFSGDVGDAEAPMPITSVPTKSPTSTRNYVRTNVSASQMDPLAQTVGMVGQSPQPSQPQGPVT